MTLYAHKPRMYGYMRMVKMTYYSNYDLIIMLYRDSIRIFLLSFYGVVVYMTNDLKFHRTTALSKDIYEIVKVYLLL